MDNVSSFKHINKNVPKLRFPGFEGTEYKHETVGTLFKHSSKRNADGSNKNVITNSAEHGLIPQRDFFDKDIAVEGNTQNYYIIQKGDFVYNPRKSTTAPYGPFNCYMYDNEGIVSPLYTCLSPKYTEFTDYLLWYFKSPTWYSYIYHNGAQGGARHDRVGMTNELMDGIPVNLPSIQEQHKVSSFLSLLDDLISKQRELVEKLKTYKRGVIQSVFGGNSLNKFSSNNWGRITIKDLFQSINDRNHSDECVLTIIQGKGTIPRDSVERRITYNKSSVSSYKKVKKNDFILHLRSFEGGLEIANEDGIVSPAYTILRANNSINPIFFYSYFRSYDFINNKLRVAVEGIRDGKSINMDTFWNIEIPYPCMTEQNYIADLLSKLDEYTNNQTLQFKKLISLKSALLQQMFI